MVVLNILTLNARMMYQQNKLPLQLRHKILSRVDHDQVDSEVTTINTYFSVVEQYILRKRIRDDAAKLSQKFSSQLSSCNLYLLHIKKQLEQDIEHRPDRYAALDWVAWYSEIAKFGIGVANSPRDTPQDNAYTTPEPPATRKKPNRISDCPKLEINEYDPIFNMLLEELRWISLMMIFIAMLYIRPLQVGVQYFVKPYWIIFHEWPDDLQRTSVFHWPYNIRIPVVVLWSMCWRFAIYEIGNAETWLEELDWNLDWNQFFGDSSSPQAPESSFSQINFPELSRPELDCSSLPVQSSLYKTLQGPSSSLHALQLSPIPNLQHDVEYYGDSCLFNGVTGTTQDANFGPLRTGGPVAPTTNTDKTSKISSPIPQSVESEGNTSVPTNPAETELSPSEGLSSTAAQPQNNAIKRRSRKTQEYVCPDCDKTFFKERELGTHMFSHDKQRSHCCAVCGVKFTRRDNVNAHMERLHPVEWEASASGQAIIRRKRKRKGKEAQKRGDVEQPCKVTLTEASNGSEEGSNQGQVANQQQRVPSQGAVLSSNAHLQSSQTELETRVQKLLEENERLKQENEKLKEENESQKRKDTAKIARVSKLNRTLLQILRENEGELEDVGGPSGGESTGSSISGRPSKRRRH